MDKSTGTCFMAHGVDAQLPITIMDWHWLCYFVIATFMLFTHKSSYCLQRVLAIAILSVHLSHGWITQKRCKLELPNLHCQLPEDS